MAKKHNDLWLYLASGLIPFCVITVCFALLQIAPFGDRTILFFDSSIQYLDFASYLQSVFAGENDLIYTFSKNLGGEMVSLFAYYLFSPFSLLFALGTTQQLPVVFTLVVVLKTAACGVTFFYGVSRRFGCKASHLIFSTAYALMAYNTLFGWNIMWMDGVLILPLLALGLERLWQGEKPWLYVGCLAYALMTNFYIGYMLCIASVIFSFALMAAMEDGWKARGIRFGTFALASCIGGFGAAFSWLPTFFTLIGGRGEATADTFVWARTFNILGLAGKLVAGSGNADQIELGLPHVFCGIFTLLLAMLFFLHGKIRLRNRIIALSVMGVLIVSFCIRGLDVIWHGFSPNNAMNFRYAFILSYVLLMTAVYGWQRRSEIPKLLIVFSAGVLLIMCAGLVFMKFRMDISYLSVTGICISGAVVVTTALCLLLGKNLRAAVSAVLILACIFEMGANYYLSIGEALKTAFALNISSYQSFVEQTGAAVDAVKAMDDGFYRLEKTYSRNKNDAMLLNYNGLTHFSSSQDKSVPRFMEQLGMNHMEGIWAEYGSGSTALADSLFGIKYLLSYEDMALRKGYNLTQTVNDVGIYENAHALPIAMLASGEVMEHTLDVTTPFSMQNGMMEAILGAEAQALVPVENWTVTMENLVLAEDGCTYAKENVNEAASLTYTVEVTRQLPLYFYFAAPQQQNVALYINGNPAGSYFNQYRWDVVCAGTYAEGDLVEITLVPQEETLTVTVPSFCYEDREGVCAAVQTIRTSRVTLEKKTSSHLTGSIQAQHDGVLLLTIPFDEGWQLTIDGEKTQYSRALGLFPAAQISKGEHTFALHYVPRGSVAGCCISVAAIAAALLWSLLMKRKKQMP